MEWGWALGSVTASVLALALVSVSVSVWPMR
jgi:hypothetical protein